MSRRPLLVLGLMSGTSADAIDLALVKISGAPPNIKSELLNHTTIPYAPRLQKEILRIAEQQKVTAGDLSQLNFRLGEAYAEATLQAVKKFRVATKKIDLIASHGQTIFHQGPPIPYQGRPTASTLQIGEPAIIAARTGITTIADFRPADIAQHGQGAPLVPYADYLLYRHATQGRISLNLGGIANITVLPAGASPGKIFAFDTGPANMLIDALVQHFTHNHQRYDRNGVLANQGRPNAALVNELMKDPYLKKAPPKSTGREYYGREYVKNILTAARRYKANPNDTIRAATIFTSLSIVDALNRYVLPKHKIAQLVVSGGGAKNPLMLAQLAAALPQIDVLPSDQLNVPTEAKEAYAFALMAYETFHHRPSNLPSATGARGPAILGKISYPPPS